MQREIIDRVRAVFDRIKDSPETRPDGVIRLIELRSLLPELLLYVEALEADRADWVDVPRLVVTGERQMPNPAISPSCANCRYWHPVDDEDGHDLGRCRRFPPTYDGWAMTAGTDWCGEHEAP